MHEETTDPIPSLGEPGTAESTPSQTGTADVAPSNDPAAPESQVTRAASESPEATATSPVKHGAVGNPGMPEQTSDLNLSPAESGATEPTPSQEDLGDAAPSNNAAGAEDQVARAASDSPEATVTSPVVHDVLGNPGMPEETTDPISSPVEPGTAEPTSPPDDMSDASARKDEAGAEGQVLAVPSKAPQNNLAPTAGGDVTQAAELEDGGCFEPFIPQASVSPAPKPAPKPKPRSLMPTIERILRDNGIPTPTDTTPETEIPAPAAAEDRDDAEMAQSSETLAAPVETPLSPPRVATAVELHTWIKRSLLAQTHLAENAAELVAFFAISTWFQTELVDPEKVFSCIPELCMATLKAF